MRLTILFLLATTTCFGQGVRYDNVALKAQNPLTGIKNAVITVCTSAGTGIPCAPLATTYTDATLTTPCPATQQVVLANTSTCVASSDVFGNFGFWLAPSASYIYTITTPGIPGYSTTITVPCPVTGNCFFSGTITFTGGILANTTQQNSKLAAEFANAGSWSYAQVRIGQPNVNTGTYYSSAASANGTISQGSVPDTTCGSGWRATDTASSDQHFGGGGALSIIEYHGDTGLTAGNCFTPTLRWYSNFGSAAGYVSLRPAAPSLFGGASDQYNLIQYDGSGNLFYGNGNVSDVNIQGGAGHSINLFNNVIPNVDNTRSFGASAARWATIYSVTFQCGATGTITCAQSDGSNNVFIGNGNVNDMTISAGSGHTIFAGGNSKVNIGGGITTAAPPSGNTGFQHKRVAGCATGAPLDSTCDVTVTWTSSFADANYTAVCVGDVVTSGVPIVEGIDISAAKTGAAITVRTLAITAAAAQFTTIDCTAVHD